MRRDGPCGRPLGNWIMKAHFGRPQGSSLQKNRQIPIYQTDINLGLCLVGDGVLSCCYEFAGRLCVFATIYRLEAKRLPYNMICNQSDKSEFSAVIQISGRL